MAERRNTGFLAWDGEEIFEGDTLETIAGTIGTAQEVNGIWVFQESSQGHNPLTFSLDISRALSTKDGHSVLRKK